MPKKLRTISFDPDILVKVFNTMPDDMTAHSEEHKKKCQKLMYVLRREILSLPLEQRKVIYEVFFNNKRITEVVQEMMRIKKCNKNTVYNNYYKGTISLCKKLYKLGLLDFTNNKIMIQSLKLITTNKYYG